MKHILYLAVLIILIFLSFPPVPTKAQSVSGNDWSTPVNLSHSGSATGPAMAFDSNGLYQVLWQDAFMGPVHVSGNATGWSEPAVVPLPIEESVPALLADQVGNVHIFWIGSDGGLYYSRATAAEFAQTSSAESALKLSESALDFDAALDPNGNIHLSYIQPLDSFDSSAGVYYRYLDPGSGGWSSPVGLYLSPYFRSLTPTDSNVGIATATAGEAVQVYVTWDNRPRDSVYLAKSLDGGGSWGEAEEVDKADVSLGSGNPQDLQVSALENSVLLVWQRSNPAGGCSFQYRWSGDSGSTWSETRQLLEPSPLCGEGTRLLSYDSSYSLLWTILQGQVNLVAWDWGKKIWSDAQVQNELAAFNDPETSNPVTLGCQQPQLGQGSQLAVVGCDSGEEGGDIWFTSRGLNNIADWFPTEADWSEPVELAKSTIEMLSPVLVSGPGQLRHILWSQALGDGSEPEQTSIYYIRGDGESWTQPIAVIQAQQGNADQPSAAIDDQGRLLVAWSSIDDGRIMFSWANAANASNSSEWSDPIPISQLDLIARDPNLLVSHSGTIFVIYAVPLNEGRGVYLTQSKDGGETWTQPVQVFDGVKAGWQMVDQPQIAETQNGELHVLWIHAPQPGGGKAKGLYYARSEDGGETWTEAEEVTAGNVLWSQITSAEQDAIYRNWQEEINGEPVIRYQHKHEGETGWGEVQSLSSFGENLQNAKLVLDPFGTLHLLQIVQGSTGRFTLRHWIWDGQRWTISENVELGYNPGSRIGAMAASTLPEGRLDLIYSTLNRMDPSVEAQYSISYLERPLQVPVGLPTQQPSTPVPAELPTPTVLFTLEPTPELQPTSTPDMSALNLAGPTGSGGGTTSGLVIGVVLSGLIVATVIAYRFLKTRFAS